MELDLTRFGWFGGKEHVGPRNQRRLLFMSPPMTLHDTFQKCADSKTTWLGEDLMESSKKDHQAQRHGRWLQNCKIATELSSWLCWERGAHETTLGNWSTLLQTVPHLKVRDPVIKRGFLFKETVDSSGEHGGHNFIKPWLVSYVFPKCLFYPPSKLWLVPCEERVGPHPML